MTKIIVEFDVNRPEDFERALQKAFEQDDNVLGLRSDTSPTVRAPLRQFADEMEKKLKQNDHKTAWRNLPIEALFRQMMLEIEEFKVAREFLTVREARGELVDVANFSLILWDRLSLEKQEAKVE